jgi:5-methylcytosine-specific restriction endonuclease McrA
MAAAKKRNQGMNWIRLSTRMAIYHRDGFVCVYCGATAESGAKLTLDHRMPVEAGGGNEPSNLVTACLSCNSAKCDLPTRAWFTRLRDKGIDTDNMGLRIRALARKVLNRAEGLRLARIRRR